MQEHGGTVFLIVGVEADGRAVEGTESQSYVVIVCAAVQRRVGRLLAQGYLICLQKAHTPFPNSQVPDSL